MSQRTEKLHMCLHAFLSILGLFLFLFFVVAVLLDPPVTLFLFPAICQHYLYFFFVFV